MKALRGIAIGLGIGLIAMSTLLAIYNAGLRAGRARQDAAALPEPAVPPPPTPVPVPVPSVDEEPLEPVDPIVLLVRRAELDLRRLEGLDENTRESSLRLWDGTNETTYAMLARGVEAHFRERECFRGTVEEIHDLPTGGVVMRLRVGGFDDVMWVESLMRPGDDVVAHTRVRACGYIAGTHTYESQAGWTITLPSMLAVWVDRRR